MSTSFRLASFSLLRASRHAGRSAETLLQVTTGVKKKIAASRIFCGCEGQTDRGLGCSREFPGGDAGSSGLEEHGLLGEHPSLAARERRPETADTPLQRADED